MKKMIKKLGEHTLKTARETPIFGSWDDTNPLKQEKQLPNPQPRIKKLNEDIFEGTGKIGKIF